jgi:hypothetical protein
MSDHDRPKRLRIKSLDLGSLPADRINGALGLNLAAGVVHFSIRAQQHAMDNHADEFALCLRHIERIVVTPDYIGQGPGQTDGFELVGEAHQDQAIILVAIKVRPDAAGRYIVASTYLIDRNKLERRIRKGFLKPVP